MIKQMLEFCKFLSEYNNAKTDRERLFLKLVMNEKDNIFFDKWLKR